VCIRRTPKKTQKQPSRLQQTPIRDTLCATHLWHYIHTQHTHTHYIQDHKRIDGKRACVSLIWRFQILWCIAFHLSKVERKQVLLFILFFNRQKCCCRMNEKKLFSFFFVLFRSEYNTLSVLVKGKFSMPFALAFIYLFIYFVVNTRKRKKKKKRRDVHVSRSPGAYLPFCIMTYQ
jgi:hypothetical protein